MRNVDAAGSRAWHDGLAALHRYVEVRHTAAPPTSARVEGFDLGEWVKQLRSCYWTGTLEPDRVELLEALPGWRWSGTHERQWRARLDALRRYAARNGTSAVPPSVVVGSRMRLGQWAAAQKASQAAGTLPRPAAELLEQVPGWEWEEQSQPEEETTRWTIVLDALRRKLGTGQQDEFDDGPPQDVPARPVDSPAAGRLPQRNSPAGSSCPGGGTTRVELEPGSRQTGNADCTPSKRGRQSTEAHARHRPPSSTASRSGAGYTPDAASTAQASCPQTGPRSSRHSRDGSGTSSTRRGRTHWTRCVPMRQSMARPTFRRATQPEACSSASGCVTSVWCTAGDSSLRVASPSSRTFRGGDGMGGVQLNRREFPRLGTLPAAHAAASAASAARIANTAG